MVKKYRNESEKPNVKRTVHNTEVSCQLRGDIEMEEKIC